MAKSALATGAVALGTLGTGTVSAQAEEAAVFASALLPGVDFDVIAELPTSTTVDLLQAEGETLQTISQPDEWNGHIIRYDIGQDSGYTTFLFVRGGRLSTDDSGSIGEEASVLAEELNLMSTTVSGNGGNGDIVEDDEEDIVEDDEEDGVSETNVTVTEGGNVTENGGE